MIFKDPIQAKSGSSTIIKYDSIYESYKDKLSQSVLDECRKFSSLYYKLFNRLDNVIEGRKLLKQEAKEIKEKSSGENPEVLIKYIEDLILSSNNLEFMIPYYSICKDLQHDLNPEVLIYENHHFGILGTVNEILEEGL